jgi:cell division protein ZapA
MNETMQQRTPVDPESSSRRPEATPESVNVEIYDQIYHLRGVDTAYIERLAEMVDTKMRAVSAHGGTVDSLRVAVLAALNIADELSALRQQYDALAGTAEHAQTSYSTSLRSRAGSLAGMLDELLDQDRAGDRRAG